MSWWGCECEHFGAPSSNDSGPRQPIVSLSEVALHQMAYDYSIGIMTVLAGEEEEEKRSVVRTSNSLTFSSHKRRGFA